MTKDPRIYLLHIRDALTTVQRYTTDGKKRFLDDTLIQDAVIYNLAIIGEAVKKLPRSFRDRHPAIPWKRIAGLRDVVIHDYNSTEIMRIWQIVERDVPSLALAVDAMLKPKRPRARKAIKSRSARSHPG